MERIRLLRASPSFTWMSEELSGIVGAIHVSPNGSVTQSEDVIPTKVEVLPGKHWLKLTPDKSLTIGEYALVEILSPSDLNQSVWDFRVDPTLGDNPASLGPILK